MKALADYVWIARLSSHINACRLIANFFSCIHEDWSWESMKILEQKPAQAFLGAWVAWRKMPKQWQSGEWTCSSLMAAMLASQTTTMVIDSYSMITVLFSCFFVVVGYPAMAKYLNATGRHIVYSCEWPMYKKAEGGTVSKMHQNRLLCK
jgi:hypothetical protein